MSLPLRALFYRRIKHRGRNACWLWPKNQLNAVGYGQLALRRKGKRVRILAHCLSYELHINPIPDGLQVMHLCDAKRCVNPHHLITGTQLENEAGKVLRGRSNRGEDRWCATLTNAQAQELLNQFRKGVSVSQLSHKFCVTYWVAYSIAKRLRWKYLK